MYFPGAKNVPAVSDAAIRLVTVLSAGCTSAEAAPPIPRITQVDLRRGKALKSPAVLYTIAATPVCSGSGGFSAGVACGACGDSAVAISSAGGVVASCAAELIATAESPQAPQ